MYTYMHIAAWTVGEVPAETEIHQQVPTHQFLMRIIATTSAGTHEKWQR